MKNYFITLFLLLFFGIQLGHSQIISIDARVVKPEIIACHLNMGHPGEKGKELLINNKYITLGGKPILPVMGEIHYTRVKRENWEETILKMKANGINIIAYYIFWTHHEEIEGKFNWNENYDLRAFTELCKKHTIWAYPRIGPWCHGEVRNGGLPDWLMQKGFRTRTNDPEYQFYAERLYKEIAQQLDGLYYKDNGPIIGVQLENEYWRGKGGEDHIRLLKKTAQKYGIDVPLYTVTAWRNASVPENEVIPLWGGYPAAPWNTNLKKIEYNESYLFTKPVNDESIGHKENNDSYKPDYSPYPYLTCELGVGNQLSEHRRPIIDPIDGMAIATSNIASGSNLPGYYVFTGGLNPVGQLTTLEEDQWESGYWNEYPDISYDFQAAISEAGEIKMSYHELKPLHYFLNDFGDLLAPMQPVVPENNQEWDDLQYSFRTNGSQGFLFVSNYYRGHVKSIKKNVQFNIQLKKEKIQLPKKPINIHDSTVLIWPVNLKMGETVLKYASCQLICNLQHTDTVTWVFKQNRDIQPEFLFSAENIKSLEINGGTLQTDKQGYFVKNIQPGLNKGNYVYTTDGTVHRIIVLSENESRQFWYFKNPEKEYVFISKSNLYMDEKNQLHSFTIGSSNDLQTINCSLELIREPLDEPNVKKFDLPLHKADLIDSVQWLQLNPANYDESRNLYRKLFFKDITLSNTANIRKAGIYLVSGLEGEIRVNNRWLNQQFIKNKENYLDLTAYINKGVNNLMFVFPYTNEPSVMAAIIEVEYYNSDKEHILSDTSWLTTEQYKIPAPWEFTRNKRIPITHPCPDIYKDFQFTTHRFAVALDLPKINAETNRYLRINYIGNKAQCRLNKKLVADNFNNGTIWTINLSNLNINDHDPLIFELEPWKGQGIYLEGNEEKVKTEKAQIEDIYLEVEKEVTFKILEQ